MKKAIVKAGHHSPQSKDKDAYPSEWLPEVAARKEQEAGVAAGQRRKADEQDAYPSEWLPEVAARRTGEPPRIVIGD